MKQFFRYLLLIACVMVIGVWGWSYYRSALVVYTMPTAERAALINSGALYAASTEGLAFAEQQSLGWHYNIGSSSQWNNSRSTGKQVPFLGLIVTEVTYPILNRNVKQTSIQIPVWMIFTPLFLLTLALWYHPIKNWWRGTNRQGFAVEVVDKNKEHQTPETKE